MAKVLIVDDEPDVRRALVRLVQAFGYETCTAENGDAGIRQMRLEAPDVVILDMVMPLKDGWSVLREKVLDPSIAAIPVIILSGLAADIIRDRADVVSNILRGAMVIMSKPFDDFELERTLRTLLSHG